MQKIEKGIGILIPENYINWFIIILNVTFVIVLVSSRKVANVWQAG